jgi:hypothetical protein
VKRPQIPHKEEIVLPTKVIEKSIGKMEHMQLLAIFLVPMVALILGVASPGVFAQEPLELEAKIIFETNLTDEDTGIQVFTDGDPWRTITIYYPNGDPLVTIDTDGDLSTFGLTELFSESNEPNWDDMPLADILALFPAGNYEFAGESVNGEDMEGTARLSHRLPCAPDEEFLSPSEETVSAAGVVLEWAHVTGRLNNNNQNCQNGGITVETYQVIVENLDTENEFSIFLEAEPGINQVTLPPEFVEDGVTYKWEVLAIANNGNQTIAETHFCTGDPDEDPCPEPED